MNKSQRAIQLAKAEAATEGGLEELRQKLIQTAQEIISEYQGEGRAPSAEEADGLSKAATRVTALDTTIKAAKESAAVAAKFKGHAIDQDGNRISGGSMGTKFLGLTTRAGVKTAAVALAKGMTNPDPSSKALVAAGTATGDVPMIGIYERPDLPTTILDLLPMRLVESHFSYLRETERADNAGVVAPGAEKPRSDYLIERIEDHLRVVAHIGGPVDKYVLEDSASVTAFLERRMLHGLRLGLEDALLVGDGLVAAGPPRVDNVKGILNQSGIQVRAFADDLLTTIRRAITSLERLGHQASALVLSPDDWEMLELTRRVGDGGFDLGPANLPVDRAKRLVWGVPTVTSNGLPAKTGLMLDTAAVDFVGDGRISVDWNPYSGFSRNEVEVRAETRIGVNLTSPLGVIKIATAA